MKTKKISSNLSKAVVNQINATFETPYQGMQITAESFFVLRRFTQNEIKGIFSENELKAIVDMMDATMFEPKMAQKATLKAGIEDSETYDGTLSKWEVNKEAILKKVSNMTEAQAFFIMFEAWNFWYAPKTSETRDLEKFVDEFKS